MVAHEGCSRRGRDCADDGSGSGKRGFDGRGRKISCTASPQSGDRTPPRISGTPKNHSDPAHLDIGGPLPRTGSAPRERPRRWSPTEEIGWSRTQEIRWYPSQEIGWVRSQEILQLISVAGYDGREHPPSQEIIDLLTQALRKDAASKAIIAAAIVWDARIRRSSTAPQTDAIAVALDHRDNYSVIVYFPYTLSGKKLNIGEPFSEAGHAAIFVH